MNEWYTKIRDRVSDKYFREAADNGESLTKSPVRFREDALKSMVATSLNGFGQSSQWKSGTEFALILLLDWNGVGRYIFTVMYNNSLMLTCFSLLLHRAAELGHLSYSKADFNNGLAFNWIMTKVAKEKYISFNNAYKDPRLDPLLMFAFYFMSGGGRQHIPVSGEKDWVKCLIPSFQST